MKIANLVRVHWAALRALLVLTVITGFAYPALIGLVAQLPGLSGSANGSIIEANGKPVGSSLIGQGFTDSNGHPIPKYFQSRPSAAGDGYDPLSTSASNLGPENIVDVLGDPSLPAADNGSKDSLLTTVCSRSLTVAETESLGIQAGARPYCTGDGKGAVLSVIGPRDSRGNVVKPTRVVSVNQLCEGTATPFVAFYDGVRVECAKFGEAAEYGLGQIVPIRGSAPADPVVPADAVTASGSGLDPDISVAYAELQIPRVARVRGVSQDQVRAAVRDNQSGRTFGFIGEPRVNVLALNLELDRKFPVNS